MSVDKLSISVGVAAATAVGVYAMQQKPDVYPYSLINQSKMLPGPERIRTSQFNMGNDLISVCPDGSRTLFDAFEAGCKIGRASPFMGKRDGNGPFTWQTYDEAWKRSIEFGAGLRNLGLEKGTLIGLFSKNRPEWVIAEQGCNSQSIVVVPLYDTLGPEAVEHIINQGQLSVIVCDADKMETISALSSKCKSLKTIIVMTGGPMRWIKTNKHDVFMMYPPLTTTNQLRWLPFKGVESIGQLHPCVLNRPEPDDWATICYTSGTTGLPKGAILSHKNIISVAAGLTRSLNGVFDVTQDDVHISYLPLAHMLERSIQLMIYMNGAKIGFFRGDIALLIEDIQELKPTIFPSVPRLLNKVFDKVMAGASESTIKRFMFDRALAAKGRLLDAGIMRNNTIWDKLVFAKVKETLGGRVRLVATGAAPIGGAVLEFLRCALGCEVVEGYGQTEGGAGATLTLAGDYSKGHVGTPLACCHVKLVDVPEMNYFSKDDKGEICFRGPNVFQGYLNNEAKTKETIDKEGWVHTGDIGAWTPKGQLKIIDRKKHIFKLAQGEYIAPEKIENVYARLANVAQIFVHGESLQSQLVGVVVPEEDVFVPWCKANSISGATLVELCQQPKAQKLILAELRKLGKEGGLQSFEQLGAVVLSPVLFSVENGLLTPTFKTKRPAVKTTYTAEIAQMYQMLEKTKPKAKL